VRHVQLAQQQAELAWAPGQVLLLLLLGVQTSAAAAAVAAVQELQPY
jgi:hypothetical protein